MIAFCLSDSGNSQNAPAIKPVWHNRFNRTFAIVSRTSLAGGT